MNKTRLIALVTKSRNVFLHFVAECNLYYRDRHELNQYRQIIALHRKTGNIIDLLNQESFCALVYDTLKKWNMDQRAAKLVSFDCFKTSLMENQQHFQLIYPFKLTDLGGSHRILIKQSLEKLFCNLHVMKSERRLVGVSKTLHFILPDLVIPVDSKYTTPYFFGYNRYSSIPEKEFQDFWYIMDKTYSIIRRLNIQSHDARGGKWNTCIPKLTDNAIIGFNRFLSISTVEEVLGMAESMVVLDSQEKNMFIDLLRKQKKNIDAEKRSYAKKKLLLEKARAAGISVSEDEIDSVLID